MKKNLSNKDNIYLIVLTPQETLFEGNVEKVELPGEKGRFMVLNNHAPVITSLAEGFIVYAAGGKEGRLAILSGFASVNNNVITVCAEV